MHSPAEQHYKLLQKLLRYINGTKNWDLTYYKDLTVVYWMEFVFFCCVDSAHADDEETFRSTGGWFFFLRRGQGSVAAKSGQKPTSRCPLRNQTRSGVVTLPCKAPSSSNSWTKQEFLLKHPSNSTKIPNQWSTRRKEMLANQGSNTSKQSITTLERWFSMVGANWWRFLRNKTLQTWLQSSYQQKRSQFSAKWSSDYKTLFITLFQLTDLSLISQLSIGICTMCHYHSPIGGYVRYHTRIWWNILACRCLQ